jgi:hypothetical protein
MAGGLVSGWGVNGITSVQKGFPMQIYQSGNALTNSFGAGQLRPDRAWGSCSPGISGSAQKRLTEWFNTSCYTPVGQYSLGNESTVDPTCARLVSPIGMYLS